MQASSDQSPDRSQLIAQLGDALGMPVVCIAASWRGDNTVNLAEEGARAFISVLEAELDAAEDAAEEVALVLVGRGGLPVFAEGVWRALQGRDLQAHALVPYRADGVFTLLSLAAERCVVHPYGSLGAFDRRPIGRFGVRVDTALVAELDTLGGQLDDAELVAEIAFQRQQAKLSHRLMERIVGGSDSGLGARLERSLSAATLGFELGLSCAELERLGLDAQLAEGPFAETLWRLFLTYEVDFEILEPPAPRYTPSEVADEVEFEPATGLCGAIIEGPNHHVRYELDTGSPDPDTNVLKGQWLWGQLLQPHT